MKNRRVLVRGMQASVSMACCFIAASIAPAQSCPSAWTSLTEFHTPMNSRNGNAVRAMTFVDRDGAGSHPGFLVCGGVKGRVNFGNEGFIWQLDLLTREWSNLSGGVNGEVQALATLQNGDIVAGGQFTEAGNLPASRIARWDGTAWHAMGSGITDGFENVHDMAVAPDGSLVVSGGWWVIGGVFSPGIARWSPSAGWSGIQFPYEITDIDIRPNGNIVAAWNGVSPFNSSFPSSLIEWNGTTWSALGGNNPFVTSDVIVLANGDVAAKRVNPLNPFAGQFWWRWNGSTWSNLDGDGSLIRGGDGDLYQFAKANGPFRVEKLVGNEWQSYNVFNARLMVPKGSSSEFFMLVGNTIYLQGLQNSFEVMSNTNPVARGINGDVTSVAILGDGSVAVAGNFTQVGGTSARGVALWRSGVWQSLSDDPQYQFGLFFGWQSALAVTPTGDLIATAMRDVGGNPSKVALRRSQSGWSLAPANVGVGAGNGNSDACVLHDGRVASRMFMTPEFWNGSAFVSMPQFPANNESNAGVFDIESLADGTVVAVGRFPGTSFGNDHGVWQFVNGSWQPLGNGLQIMASTLVRMPNGDLIAAGPFTRTALFEPMTGLARWNGTAWQNFSPARPLGEVGGISVSSDGKLLASINGVVWACDGVTWSPVSEAFTQAISGDIDLPVPVLIATGPSGQIVAGGSFDKLGATTAWRIARLAELTDCAVCDSIDFNNDQLFPDDNDLIDFLMVLAGGECPSCNDIDFNNDNLFPDDTDLLAFLRVLAGGSCN